MAKKKFVTKTVFRKQSSKPILFEVYKDVVRDRDYLQVGYDDGHYSENNSWDPHYYVTIDRQILETDEEFKKRIEYYKELKKANTASRYKTYLKLKKEFENGN